MQEEGRNTLKESEHKSVYEEIVSGQGLVKKMILPSDASGCKYCTRQKRAALRHQ